MLYGFNFTKLVLLSTLIFTHSMTVILGFFITRGFYSRCAVHTELNTYTVTCSRSCDQGKITKKNRKISGFRQTRIFL